MENQYHLVSVKPEQLHLPAREDRMAVGPPTLKKIDPPSLSTCGSVCREEALLFRCQVLVSLTVVSWLLG